MEITVWTFKMECFDCEEDTVVWYPEVVGSNNGGTWEPVGSKLAEREASPIEQFYSETQEREVWGNACEHCGVYIGNFYVHREYRSERLILNEEMKAGEHQRFDCVEMDVDIKCSKCSRRDVLLPSNLCNKCVADALDLRP
jgi:hypothetical protein